MMRAALISLVLFLDSAHLPAPIALAWTNKSFRRQVIFEHKIKFIVVPLLVMILTILTVPATLIFWPEFRPIIGATIWVKPDRNFINPFTVALTLFVVWNLYHFGSQNFGLWRLWRRGRGNRTVQKSSWVAGTMVGMVGVPIIAPALTAVSMWAFGLWHWLPAIGLAAKVSGRPVLFWVAMMAAGAVITVILWVGVVYGSLAVAMLLVSIRLGQGFDHFLYDHWVWRRAMIEVFA